MVFQIWSVLSPCSKVEKMSNPSPGLYRRQYDIKMSFSFIFRMSERKSLARGCTIYLLFLAVLVSGGVIYAFTSPTMTQSLMKPVIDPSYPLIPVSKCLEEIYYRKGKCLRLYF